MTTLRTDRPETLYRPDAATASTKSSTKITIAVYLTLLVGFTALYTATAQREFSWGDCGTRQLFILHNHYYSVGDALALIHPMYIVMGHAVFRAAPAGYEMWAVNAFSGLGMAVALANLSLLVHRLTGRRWAGMCVALLLGVSHTTWWLSTMAETYTWSLAGMSLECLLLASLIRNPRWGTLAGLALVNGWGWSIHNFTLLTLPVHLTVMAYLMIRRRLPVWSVGPALGAYVVGAALYIYLILVNTLEVGFPAAIRAALFGGYGDDVLGVGSWDMVLINYGLMGLNIATLLPLLAVVGWWHFRRRLGGETALAMAAITAIHVVFVARYTIDDQFTFVLPSLWMIALAGGVGLVALADRSKKWRTIAGASVALGLIVAPAAYGLLPALAPEKNRKPFRDEIRYWVTPWKHNEHSADLFVQAVWIQLQPVCDAGKEPIVLVDATPYFPLAISKAMDNPCPPVSLQRPDQTKPLPTQADATALRAAAGGRPIYVLTPDIEPHGDIPPALKGLVEAVKDNPGDCLYRLKWKE